MMTSKPQTSLQKRLLRRVTVSPYGEDWVIRIRGVLVDVYRDRWTAESAAKAIRTGLRLVLEDEERNGEEAEEDRTTA